MRWIVVSCMLILSACMTNPTVGEIIEDQLVRCSLIDEGPRGSQEVHITLGSEGYRADSPAYASPLIVTEEGMFHKAIIDYENPYAPYLERLGCEWIVDRSTRLSDFAERIDDDLSRAMLNGSMTLDELTAYGAIACETIDAYDAFILTGKQCTIEEVYAAASSDTPSR